MKQPPYKVKRVIPASKFVRFEVVNVRNGSVVWRGAKKQNAANVAMLRNSIVEAYGD